MAESGDRHRELSRRLYAELKTARQALARSREPVAIVGLGGRFPPGPDLASFWKGLLAGEDMVTAGRPGQPSMRYGSAELRPYGAYLAEIDRFDASFFRIAPVEAELMDPQQRMLLETAWEALEDAGLDPGRLAGSRTGVFVGIGDVDYPRLFGADQPSLYAATGNSFAAAAGRIAFTLGFEGPAMALDTACSSSLVAVHQAVAALQRAEADVVLAGGVSAIVTAVGAQVFGAGGMLAPDGRCKTFDAAADGFGRGEGCGLVVMKRLSDAEQAGDRILAVIRGSAVNQDGASAGLTVPNGPSQERVIREALRRAGLEPSEVDYLEAHGTGTELGDPIEIQAAAAVYGEGRPAERPLLIGSVKTNIGHLEAAAGIAGLVKVLLAMRDGRIPKHLHFEKPNPRMDWERLPVQVTAEATPWPEVGRPVRAAVSSFGVSGTNAHLILEGYGRPGEAAGASLSVPIGAPASGRHRLPPAGDETPALGETPSSERRFRIVPLSGRTQPAISRLAARYVAWLDARRAPLEWEALSDAGWTAGVGRCHFDERRALVVSDEAGLRRRLEALAAEPEAGSPPSPGGKVAFLFTGQGSQWAGMGRDLYDREPVARAALARAEAAFREVRGPSLLEAMFGAPEAKADLDATEWTQPTLFALQAALVALWESVGVRPDAVMGHSVGELGAAHAAGCFGLEEGVRFAAARGALMGSLPREGEGAGAMAAIFAPPEAVRSALRQWNRTGQPAAGCPLDLAADNGMHQVVSGPLEVLAAFAADLERRGVRTERLRTSHAFHSGLMEPVLDALDEAGAGLAPVAPRISLVSNLTGRAASPGELAAEGYWSRQARSPVRFADGVATLRRLGVRVLVEIGPRPVLGPMAGLVWTDDGEAGSAPVFLASQQRAGEAGDEAFLHAVAGAWEAGLPVDFAGLYAGERRRRVALPTYPFERERHWVKSGRARRSGAGHPLLGERRDLPGGEVSFEIATSELAWMPDHRVFGRVVAPGALFGAQALAALRATGAAPAGDAGTGFVEGMRILRPLVLAGGSENEPAEERTVQVLLGGEEDEGRRFEVFSRAGGEDPWIGHAEGRLKSGSPPPDPGVSLPSLSRKREGWEVVDPGDLYRRFAALGIVFGPAFQGVVNLGRGDLEAVGEAALPDGQSPLRDSIHPVLLDACLQVVGALVGPSSAAAAGTFLPVGWRRLWLGRAVPDRLVCHVRVRQRAEDGSGESLDADFAFFGTEGEQVGGVEGFRVERANRSALQPASGGLRGLFYEVEWRRVETAGGGPGSGTPPPAGGKADERDVAAATAARAPAEERTEPGLWVFGPGGQASPEAEELVRELERRGQDVVRADAAPGTDAGPTPGEPAAGLPPSEWSREFWRDFFRALPASPPLRGVVHTGAFGGPAEPDSAAGLARALEKAVRSALALTQGLLEAGATPSAGLSFLTRGGQVVTGNEAEGVYGSVLWGFGRALRWESGAVPIRLLDLDPAAGTPVAELAGELLRAERENEIAFRRGERLVPRLVRRAPAAGAAAASDRIRGDRTYLVTGGFGGIGLAVARWLAAAGAGAIVLNGRRPPGSTADAAAAELRKSGATLRLEIADVGDPETVERMFRSIDDSGLPPLAGLIHCVGALADGLLPNQQWDSFERVLRPKALGAWNLHEATRDRQLDVFVLFSSLASVLGNAGQTNYAAANAFLDQLALWRRGQGLPAQAIQWGAWSGIGKAAESRDLIAETLAAAGVGWLRPEQGIEALSRLVREDAPSVVAAAMSWDSLAGAESRAPPLLGELVAEAGPDGDPGTRGSLVERVREAPDREARQKLVAEFIAEQVQAALGLSSPPPAETGFFDLGMDSITAVELRNRLVRAFPAGARLPNTLALDHPTIARLARHLVGQLSDSDAPAAPPRPAVPAAADAPVAIVGMACRFPGAPDLRAFTSLLATGRSALRPRRPEESGWRKTAEEDTGHAGYVEGITRFDASFFGINAAEARLMEPQHRLLLETAWHALESAGIPPGSLDGSRTGVYGALGSGDREYGALVTRAAGGLPGIQALTGVHHSTAVGRISYLFGLEGPAITVDTACSSSLVTVHQAVTDLQRGDTDLALAGGANVILSEAGAKLVNASGVLSRSGRSAAFEAAADGYVRGEGCGMLVLKRLADAEADGDRILAVVRGSAVNQDGTRAQLSAPTGSGEQRVMEEALERAGIEPAEVDYLEAHAVGSPLGDPVEVHAVSAAYGRGRPRSRPLLLGSVKANIGHLEAAAGVAAAIKAVVALRSRAIPGQPDFRVPSPAIPWDDLPVRVTAAPAPWREDADRPRRAGVSAFGFSGTNAHLVLEDHGGPAADPGEVAGAPQPVAVAALAAPRADSAEPDPRGTRFLPLSARTSGALKSLASAYLDALGRMSAKRAPELADLAWTAGVGRDHLPYRAGLVFSSARDLKRSLRDLVERAAAPPSGRPARVLFRFPGEGAAWVGMGRSLYETEPVARDVLDRCDRAFGGTGAGSLLDVMFGRAGSRRRTIPPGVSSPTVYALEAALGAVWSSLGVRPDAVLGFGSGRLAAACAASVFGLEDGLRLAALRGVRRALRRRPGGAMLVLPAGLSGDLPDGAPGPGRVRWAPLAEGHRLAYGSRRAIRALSDRLRAGGTAAKALPASDSAVGEILGRVLAGMRLVRPVAEILGSPSGRMSSRDALDPETWRRAALAPDGAEPAPEAPPASEADLVIEIAPRPVADPAAAAAGRVVASQRGPGTNRRARDAGGFAPAVAQAYAAGVDIRFEGLFAGERRRRIAIPEYPFRRERYWVSARPERPDPKRHALLGVRRGSALGSVTFDSELGRSGPAWLKDHRRSGAVAAPPGFLAAQLVSAAASETPVAGFAVVDDLRLHEPLVVSRRALQRAGGQSALPVQVVADANGPDGGARTLAVFSRDPAAETWVRHADAKLPASTEAPRTGGPARWEDLARGLERVDPAPFYRGMAAAGLSYGWAYRILSETWVAPGRSLGRLRLRQAMPAAGFELHPVLLEACFHTAALAVRQEGSLLPAGWRHFWLRGAAPGEVICDARAVKPLDGASGAPRGSNEVDLRLHDAHGAEIGGVLGLAFGGPRAAG